MFQEEMFIGLVLRALKNDINLKRVSAFSKRLLQVSAEIRAFLVMPFTIQLNIDTACVILFCFLIKEYEIFLADSSVSISSNQIKV